MLEISPVLAGTFEAADYAPSNNLASSQVGQTGTIDPRRYTQFDRSATEAGSVDFSFDDFLDLVNPLEHIPVLSSVYRELTDEKINPVSRVAGDILYGGAMGIASAIFGGLGAAGDALMEAQTGKDSVGNVVASLFGSDPATPAGPQLAGAASSTPSTQAPATPAPAAVPSASPAFLAALSPNSSAPATPLQTPAPQLASVTPNTMDETSQLLMSSKAFAIDPKKMPYGGVLDPSQTQGGVPNPMQASSMALALAASAPGVPQMNHTIYAGRFANGTKPTAIGAAPSAATVAGQLPPSVAVNPLPPELMQDIATLRAINQYKSTASQSTPVGTSLDVVN